MVNCSSLQFVMFGSVKNAYIFLLDKKKWMMMEIVDKSDGRIIWYLFVGLNLRFCPFYMIRKICVFSINMIRETD